MFDAPIGFIFPLFVQVSSTKETPLTFISQMYVSLIQMYVAHGPDAGVC